MPSNGLTGSLAERQAVHQHSGSLTPRHGHAAACHLAVQRSTTMVFLVEGPSKACRASLEREESASGDRLPDAGAGHWLDATIPWPLSSLLSSRAVPDALPCRTIPNYSSCESPCGSP